MPTATVTTRRLLNPRAYEADEFDPATQRLLRATIDWFEAKGKARLVTETLSDTWYSDFIAFLAHERAFATLLTPARDAAGDPDKRWDTRRNAVFNEILGFYGRPTGTPGRSRSSGSARSGRATTTPPVSVRPGCSRTARCSPSASPSAITVAE